MIRELARTAASLAIPGLAIPALGLAGLLTLAAPPTPETDPAVHVRTNAFTAASQSHTTVAATGSGWAAAWDSRRQEAGTPGVYGRLFDAWGRPASREVRLGEDPRGAQEWPALATAPDGTVWAAWQARDRGGAGVVVRRFGPGLEPLSDEMAAATGVAGDPGPPAIAAGAGGALVAWVADSGVRVRRFDRHGEPGAEWTVSAAEGGREGLPAVASLAGGWLVAWSRTDAGVRGRRLAADGRPLGAELALAGGPGAPAAIEPALASDGRGQAALAWLERADAGWAVRARLLDGAGGALAAPVTVASAERGWNSGAGVAMTPDGRFAVAFTREAGGSQEPMLRRFRADGAPLDPAPRRLATGEHGGRRTTVGGGARVAWAAAGLAVAWSGDAAGAAAGTEGDPSDEGPCDEGASATVVADRDAAGLSLLPPAGAVPPPPRLASSAPAAPVSSDAFLGAVPPIWNPDFRPRPRLAPGQAQAGGDFGFEAIPGTGWTPPDPETAVGPDRVMVMTNGAIAAFDRQGTLQWEDEIENTFGFWGELGADNFVFDPEVIWDPHAERFMAMACERSDDNRSYFLFAVSRDATPDDRADWHKYRLDVTAISDNDIDSPNLAVSNDLVLLTADFFGPDKYLLYIIDKASVLGGGAPVTTHELITGTGQQSMGIPVVYSDTATLYIVQSTEFGSNDEVILHAVTDPFGSYQRQTFTLGVSTYTYPASPPQKDTSDRPFLFEPRFWSAAERGGSIWAVHHVNSTRTRVRWYELDLGGWPGGGTPSVAQEGEIDLGQGLYTYFPSIHADALGNAAITFARSSADEYISIGRALRAAGDPPNTFRPVQVVQVSRNPHTTGRWGDYSGTQADPVEADTFWGHHEFTDGAFTSWRTWVARYDLRPEALVLAVPPLQAGQTATFTVTGADPGTTVFFAGSLDGPGITELPGAGLVMSLESPLLVGSAVADGSGVAELDRTLPPGAAGRTIWLQAVAGKLATNWEERTVQ